MRDSIEDFLFNTLAGKIIARAVITLAGFIAAKQGMTHSWGVSITIDPAAATAAATAAAHAAWGIYRNFRIDQKAGQ